MELEAWIALVGQLLALIIGGIKIVNSITSKIEKTNNKIDLKHTHTIGEINLIKRDINHLKENGISTLTQKLDNCQKKRDENLGKIFNGIQANREDIIKLQKEK